MPTIDLRAWIDERLGRELAGLGLRLVERDAGAVRVETDTGAGALFVAAGESYAEGETPRLAVGDAELAARDTSLFDSLPTDATAGRFAIAVRGALALDRARLEAEKARRQGQRLSYELTQLIEIGRGLSAVTDIDQLLNQVLERARFMAGCDAGSIYIVEGDDDDVTARTLRFKLSQNDSLVYESSEFVMPVSTGSIAGAAVVMKSSIDIPDVAAISADAPYGFDRSWDERTGYRTISVLAVPMLNLKNEVVGVVQLINKKRSPQARLHAPEDFDREVVAIDARSRELVETLASQAAVAMENAALHSEIQHIFEGFIRASVHAIEQRDPTTSGHSFRVAALTRHLAEVVDSETHGVFAPVRFSRTNLDEIETAALLHDFGKVGVREEVLVKAKKLYAPNLNLIRSRFDFIRKSIENDHLHRRLMMIEQGAPAAELAILDEARTRAVEDIEECWRVIRAANEPTVLPAGDFQRIEEIARRIYFDLGGRRAPYLENEEVRSLLVAKGSLNDEELEEIRSHVKHTISFLEQIPWGKSMRNIPLYAGAHHEKLDGTGYPRGLHAEAIPLPAKIMAVADIYDALTAADRPYKKAVPVERALHILDLEVKDNHIDGELVRLFREAEVFAVLDRIQANQNLRRS